MKIKRGIRTMFHDVWSLMYKRLKKVDPDDYNQKYNVPDKHSGLGSGGNGIVKRATCIETGNQVAIKILSIDAKADKEKRLRFEDEINTMVQAGKQVKGIIPILDYSIDGCWYVMPIAESIKSHCEDIDSIIQGVLQVAKSLSEIHALGFSHRDVKPDNMLFYEGRWVLCDFGLVDIPDNPHNLTKNHTRVGAIKTLAPEMSRYPKDADGKKADVYSLGKSLWMLLTGNKDSFDGHYLVTDEAISLHKYEELKEHHLVEIDLLLEEATRNDPEDRPTMTQFVERIIEWQETKKSIEKQQISNWLFLKQYLFYGIGPERCTWSDPDEIKRVLSLLSLLPLYSHLFFPGRGWMELKKVETSTELNSIDIHTGFYIYRVKCGKLHFESFRNPRWNYFLMEAAPVEEVVGKEVDDYFEQVIEDSPGHYVSAVDYMYGVYDYNTGEKLPSGSRLLIRCLKGKYLIILKFGPYNQISETDDGRHANCSNDEFREYVESLQNLYEQYNLLSEQEWKESYRRIVEDCPFKPRIEITSANELTVVNGKEFLKKEWRNFDFSQIINHFSGMSVGKAKYRFTFYNNNDSQDVIDLLFSDTKYYLCKDGFVRKLPINSPDVFEATNRDSAISISKGLKELIGKYCEGKVLEFEQPYFTVDISKVELPECFFTKEEIRELMKDADDRVNNTLVIDENGTAHLIQDFDETSCYPVVYETWCARNNYVGRYSSLQDSDSSYHYCLGKWRDYLRTGRGQHRDDYDPYNESEEELISEISSICEKH